MPYRRPQVRCVSIERNPKNCPMITKLWSTMLVYFFVIQYRLFWPISAWTCTNLLWPLSIKNRSIWLASTFFRVPRGFQHVNTDLNKWWAHKAGLRACHETPVRHVWTRYGHPLKGWDMVGTRWDGGMGVGVGIPENRWKVVGGRIQINSIGGVMGWG